MYYVMCTTAPSTTNQTNQPSSKLSKPHADNKPSAIQNNNGDVKHCRRLQSTNTKDKKTTDNNPTMSQFMLTTRTRTIHELVNQPPPPPAPPIAEEPADAAALPPDDDPPFFTLASLLVALSFSSLRR